MSAITVEEFVNKVSYKVDVESLKQVLRVTDKLYAHLGKALTGVSSRMDASWRTSMANMAKASSESARAIAADGHKASAAWKLRTPGAATPQGGKEGGGMGLLGMAGRLGAGYAAYSVGKFAVQSAASFEDMTTQFKVMLGSADKANAMMANIQKLAASTPLTSMGITESARTLMQFGVAADKVIPTVRMLGDVAGGNQERLNRLAYALGQTTSRGKLTGGELMQYTEAGFNPLKVMEKNAEKFGLEAGISAEELSNKVSEGAISAEMVAKAFDIATSKGGQFYQSMAEGSQTLNGLYSTMVDNIQMSLVKAMQPLIPLLKEFVDWLGQLDWTPVVNTILVLADVLTKYIIPGFKVLRDSVIELGDYLVPITILLVGAFGPRLWAMLATSRIGVGLLKAATLAYGAVARFLGIEAMQNAGRQVTANTMVRLSWANMGAAATTAGVAMKTALLSLVTPMNVLMVGMLGIWALYNKAKKETAGAIDEEDRKMDMFWIQSYRDTARVDPLEDLYAKRTAMEDRYAKTGALDGGKLAALNKRIADKEARKADYEMRYERVFGKKPGDSMFGSDIAAQMQQLQNINNNTKKVSITQNNNIQMPVTVDDKGQTQLTPGAVNSLVDTKLRSVLNVKFLGVLAQGI